MPISHKKEYGLYHWDTFDNETFLVDEADTLEEIQVKLKDHYGDRLRKDGADRADIVDSKGNVIKKYNVG